MKKLHVLLLLPLMMLLLSSPSQAQYEQQERIISFRSFIRVHNDGTITVNEKITVYCGLDQIKRGIFRVLPVVSKDKYGNSFRTRYNILSVERDGVPEPYKIKFENQKKKIYIGQEDVFLKPGVYTYDISYEAPRQIGFFEGYDEIYWNVTGNDWAFQIDTAEAIIRLPAGTNIMSHSVYTGAYGSKGEDARYFVESNGDIHFISTAALGSYEGMSVAVAFPKGIIPQPTTMDNIMFLLRDNPGTTAALVIFILSFLYFLLAWFKVGIDPAKGSIMPMYYPPDDLSPAAMRYLDKMAFDNKIFSSGIVNMAVKKYLRITQSGKEFTLERTSQKNVQLSAEENAAAASLFGGGDSIELDNSNHTAIMKSINDMHNSLKEKYVGKLFFTNTKWWIPGLLVAILAVVLQIILADDKVNLLIVACILTPLVFLVSSIFMSIFKLGSKQGSSTGKRILSAFSLLPMIIVCIALFMLFGTSLPLFPIAVIALLIAQLVIFFYLLKAPTKEGRKVMDHIEGFKLYLSVAEKDELELRNPPEKTPELFEKYLPYAMALGVENKWGERFTSILARAMEEGTYHPNWYTGATLMAITSSSFAHDFGSSFSSAISSSSVSPGSSSGGFGGGFSGGGGGGGGGGGW
ncbi:MAG: DUF2207 domain-containing protein [Bacteroidota bacterium]